MVPTFDKFLYPVLSFLKSGEEKNLKVLQDDAVIFFGLKASDIELKVKGGSETLLHSRVQWATTYLNKAGLIEKPKRGFSKITEEGNKVLESGITDITPKWLCETYPSFYEFAKVKKKSKKEDAKGEESDVEVTIDSESPTEAIKRNFSLVNKELASQLLEIVKKVKPSRFEAIVVDLLVAMGYGDTDGATVTQYTKDDGIDGIINEDKLGLNKIYIQAKRWTDAPVDKSSLKSFVGTLADYGATKGVFITTSRFVNTIESKPSPSGVVRYYETKDGKLVVLIDGEGLCELMIKYNVGVADKDTLIIKKVDTDYFEEDE